MSGSAAGLWTFTNRSKRKTVTLRFLANETAKTAIRSCDASGRDGHGPFFGFSIARCFKTNFTEIPDQVSRPTINVLLPDHLA